MNIRQAREEIIRTITAYTARKADGAFSIPILRQRPLLLIGPPGVGKTAVMEQAAKACGVGFVSYSMTHHTRQSALGLPYIEHRSFGGTDYTVTEYTMSEIIASVYRCMEESGCKNGLLFLDEINCVSETLAPAILQFLQNKTFGSHRLPEGWVLAAAGNPPEYNKSVREFDIATLDRLKYIEVEADYAAWRAYALQSGVHGAILAWLDVNEDRFYEMKQSYAGRRFVTARGWEDLSCILLEYERQDFQADEGLVRQYLHDEELARDFFCFYAVYRSRQQNVPVRALLSGDGAALDRYRLLLAKSSFPDQILLIHLILSGIGCGLSRWEALCREARLLSDAAERLERFRRQQKLPSLWEALDPFLAREHEILKIREEHGLSSSDELDGFRHALDRLKKTGIRLHTEAVPERKVFAAQQQEDQKREEKAAAEVLTMLRFGVAALGGENAETLCTGQVSHETVPAENAVSAQSDPAAVKTRQPQNGPASAETLSRQASPASAEAVRIYGNSALVFFLSSLKQNPLAAGFLRAFPENACAPLMGLLDFPAREAALKELTAAGKKVP